MDSETDESLTKAAVLMMSLNAQSASQVMKHLTPKQVQKLGVAMAGIEGVDKDHLSRVISDFFGELGNKTRVGVNSQDHIKSVLINALGEKKASGVIDRILLGSNTKGLDSLKWMDARSVADVIRQEHPQIQTIVLSYLDPDQSSEIMMYLDEKQRSDIIMRIATLENIQPNALHELNDIMEKQFSGAQQGQAKQVGGIKRAADILNNLDGTTENQLMEDLKDRDPDLTQNIQDLMFVFDNLLDVDDRGIQALLREISSDGLIIALKGADEAVREKIFSNMSKRAADLMRDDLEAKGPVRLSEVEAAQKEILMTARKMADAGEISLGNGGEEML